MAYVIKRKLGWVNNISFPSELFSPYSMSSVFFFFVFFYLVVKNCMVRYTQYKMYFLTVCPLILSVAQVYLSFLCSCQWADFFLMSHEKSLLFGRFTCDYDSWKPAWLGIIILGNVFSLAEFSLHAIFFFNSGSCCGAA